MVKGWSFTESGIQRHQGRVKRNVSLGYSSNSTRNRRWYLQYGLLLIGSTWLYVRTRLDGQNVLSNISLNHEFLPSLPSTTLSWPTNIFWKEEIARPGCYAWEGIMSPAQVHEKLVSNDAPPSGLVVSLLLGDHLLPYVCNFFPSQLAHFIIPQHLDVLFVIPKPSPRQRSTTTTTTRSGATVSRNSTIGKETSPITMRALQKCLNLMPVVVQGDDDNHHGTEYFAHKEWHNMDGSTLTTWEHRAPTYSHTTRIFLAETELNFPTYIRNNMSLLDIPIEPKSCQAPLSYIQATRWYIYEMLHLQILQEYDYFIKLDSDVVFVQSIPVNLLHDMSVRGALFGHTAQYPDHVTTPCGNEAAKAVQTFSEKYRQQLQSRLQQQNFSTPRTSGKNESHLLPPDDDDDDKSASSSILWDWDGYYCSASHPKLYVDSDRYYSNLIIGRTDYFQSMGPQQLGKFLSDEWEQGFFRHRWGDQIYWHFALGLFAGPHFESQLVVDYTEFRCAPEPNCWMSTQEGRRIPGASVLCHNPGGSFLHTKDWHRMANQWNRWGALQEPAYRGIHPYKTKYYHDCRSSIRWK